MILVTVMLIYSVIRIHRAIKHLEHVFPNECFMVWHIWNFTLTMILILLARLTQIISIKKENDGTMDLKAYEFEKSSIILAMIENVVTFYGVVFLLYVILKFSNNKNESDEGTEEQLPAVLFVKNKMIVKSLGEDLTRSEFKRK